MGRQVARPTRPLAGEGLNQYEQRHDHGNTDDQHESARTRITGAPRSVLVKLVDHLPKAVARQQEQDDGEPEEHQLRRIVPGRFVFQAGSSALPR